MRHVYAYRVTYAIATLIILGAMLFAWLRSHDVPPAADEAGAAQGAAAVQAVGRPTVHVRF